MYFLIVISVKLLVTNFNFYAEKSWTDDISGKLKLLIINSFI